MNKLLLVFLLAMISQWAFSQEGERRLGADVLSRQQQQGNPNSSNFSRNDSIGFEHRDDAKDSITVTYRFLDSLRSLRLESNIDDFYKYYMVPYTWQHLGNSGAAGYSLIFSPNCFNHNCFAFSDFFGLFFIVFISDC